MSMARKCDRCGTYHDGRIYKIDVIFTGIEVVATNYDLCPDCELEFEEFMRGVKPKTLLDRLANLVNKGF